MEINENVSVEGAKEFMEEEIKKVSGNWVNYHVNIRAFEKRQKETVPTEEALSIHKEVESEMKNKNDKQKLSYLKKLDEDKRKSHQEVEAFNRLDEAIEINNKGIKESEELLQIMQEVKKELI